MAEQYLPLYRKYRPQEFSDLVGQENLVKAFTNAINTGKIAHAYLFCGPRGTGKTSSARILAKSLNCQNGPTLTPCGKCPSCLDILNGTMLDVIEMDAASNRSVEDAQNIIDKIHYAPVNGKYKIFIIDEVHMISKTAFNALLKTLEEPPENVIFILATTEPQKVLETIISRCQRFDFRRITVDDIVKRLEFISEKEGIKISRDALYTIAKNSQGGMRDALALLDQISVLDVENEITTDEVNDMLGKIDNDTLINLSQFIFDKSVEKTIQKINEIYAKGNEPLQIIENLIQYFRNLSVVKTCHDEKTVSELTFLSKDAVDRMKKQVQNVMISEISALIDRLTYYYREIKYTNNRYLWLELCFIDISSENLQKKAISQPQPERPQTIVKPVSSLKPQIEEQLETVENSESKELPKQITNEVNEEILPQKEEKTPIENISEIQNIQTQENKPQKLYGSTDDWKNLLEMIDSPPSRSFFNTFAKPVEMSNKKVVITFKNEIFGKRAKEPQKEDALKKACLKFYNVPSIELEIKIGEVALKSKIQNPEPIADEQKNQKQDEISLTQNILKESEFVEENSNSDLVEMAEVNEISDNQPEYKVKYSDQVNMVKDLFDAKVFD
ncbi:DNA polymerase III subunit gamma/tau [bacterium]|nr:DNA polymerase III subunit gamma/tau [bacterium]